MSTKKKSKASYRQRSKNFEKRIESRGELRKSRSSSEEGANSSTWIVVLMLVLVCGSALLQIFRG